MQKLYIKIAQHTLLIILLWFQNIFGSYFSQSFNRRSASNSKIIAHFWSLIYTNTNLSSYYYMQNTFKKEDIADKHL